MQEHSPAVATAPEKLSIVPLTPDRYAEWDEFCRASPDAWFWHTSANMEFNFAAAQNYEARNLSFFILRGEKPVGIVPLLVERTRIGGDFFGWDAAYYGGPLPWPAFLAGLPDFDLVENYAFQEIERQALQAGAGRIRLRLSPPQPMGNEQQRLARVISQHRYLDSSYASHCLSIRSDSLTQARERYRRYVKKFMPRYELSVHDGARVNSQVEETYVRLHIKDAGGQFRSRESYRFQADLARRSQAFFVTATRREDGAIAGMLLVSVYKDAAYDNSVAVDPDFQNDYVSHLLKWTAIETLLARGAKTYELGPKAPSPTTVLIPSAKNYGISHFKEGWSKGEVKTVAAAEKFLDADFLGAVMAVRTNAVKDYFGLG